MTKTLSSQAAAAKLIRQELKAAYPRTKFRVTSTSYSMGDNVSIDWTDGPTTSQVKAITGKYQYGSFDGMDDSYNMTNVRKDIPQTKFVQHQRRISDAVRLEAFEHCKKKYSVFSIVEDMEQSYTELNKQLGAWTAGNFIYRLTVNMDLTNGFSKGV